MIPHNKNAIVTIHRLTASDQQYCVSVNAHNVFLSFEAHLNLYIAKTQNFNDITRTGSGIIYPTLNNDFGPRFWSELVPSIMTHKI